MKLVDRSKGTLAVLLGAAALALVAPSCGGDDDDTTATGGKGGAGGKASTGGTANGTGGTKSGTGGAATGGNKGGDTGGSVGTGGSSTGGAIGTGGAEETGGTATGGKGTATGGKGGGTGGAGTGGTKADAGAGPGGIAGEGGAEGGSGPEGGTGQGGSVNPPEGGSAGESTGGATQGGEAGAGGSGPAPLTCSDGCANLYVPFTAENTGTFSVTYIGSGDVDLTGKTITAKVRARGFTGSNGYVQVTASGIAPDYAFYSVSANVKGLSDTWQTISLPLPAAAVGTFDPAHVLSFGIQVGMGAGAVVPVNLEIDEVTIADTAYSWLFTANTSGIVVNTNTTYVADSAITWIPPNNP